MPNDYSFVQIFIKCLLCAWHFANHGNIPSGKKNGVGVGIYCKYLKKQNPRYFKEQFLYGKGRGKNNLGL